MVGEAYRAERRSVPVSLLRRSISALPLGRVPNPVATGHAVRSAVGVLADAVTALPRIARALEQLLSGTATVSELTRLRGTLDRLERLGGFLAEELPEVQHQLESMRTQARAANNRLDVRLELTEQELRETAAAMRALAETLGDHAGSNAAHSGVNDTAKRPPQARNRTPHEQRRAGYRPTEQQATEQHSTEHTTERASDRSGKTGHAS